MTLLCHPVSRPVRVTEPTFEQEPVTLVEARRQCGIAEDNTAHDEDLRRLVVESRQAFESEAGVVCYTGSYTIKLTYFPSERFIPLYDVRPVTAITSIEYVDSAADTQTWSSSEYTLETGGNVPFIRLAYGLNWPVVRGEINGITVTFVAGHASVAAIPAEFKSAVLLGLHVSWLYRMEDPQAAARQQVGYDRVVSRIRRSTYV